MNARYRLVTVEKGKVHVSCVVQTQEEALDDLAAECILAKLGNWTVKAYNGWCLILQKGSLRRSIYIRKTTWSNDV